MTAFDPEPALAPLRGFQRATVDHVDHRFHEAGARRFLVADETGLGKSLVARGVIAKTVARLQHDDSVDRIDVVYVCSNTDIARQNLARLDIGGGRSLTVSTRLTLLIRQSNALAAPSVELGGKPLNLIAFTPGTSFDTGRSTGQAQERALLHILVCEAFALDRGTRRISRMIFERHAARSFDYWLRKLSAELREPDAKIVAGFTERAERAGLIDELLELAELIGLKRAVSAEFSPRICRLIGRFRSALAKASIDTLEPDLVILDEFQRFRHLLAPDGGDAAELARELFDHGQARVLLLSATPYKPFTLAEENAAGENHHRDFVELLRFLQPDPAWHAEVEAGFRDYRTAMVSGSPASAAAERVRRRLLDVMCRTERPPLGQDQMLEVRSTETSTTAADLLGYAALRALAVELNAPATVEYWKSAPYFVNFMDGYVLGRRLREALADPARRERLRPLLARTQSLRRADIRDRRPVEPGNGRLRALLSDCLDDDQARLLWLPPSLPYHRSAGPFAGKDRLTKRLVFSAWSATPTAVAALVSYEAERQLHAAAPTSAGFGDGRRRLEYRMDGDRPAAMTTLALFWPHPGLAAPLDPLTAARAHPDRLLDLSEVHIHAAERVAGLLPPHLADAEHRGDPSPAAAYFQMPGALPALTDDELARGLDGAAGATGDARPYAVDANVGGGIKGHVSAARRLAAATAPAARSDADLVDDLAALGAHGPGNIAWRALSRLVTGTDTVTRAEHWEAAAVLAAGLRALFNRPESIALLDGMYGDLPYWRKVLRYCADGDLQATLDEYLHHLHAESLGHPLRDRGLLEIARTAYTALTIRAVTYRAFDPDNPDEAIGFPSRFALRYGSQHHHMDDARPGEVRTAFNSPFWPFMLTTTSAGQEGIDLHWWSHALVHWNTPANPVDFEQREGRVHRYAGHAVRKNIANQHRAAILATPDQDPWSAAFRIAADHTDGLGDFAPHWLYPGPARIVRHLMPYTMSIDITHTNRVRDALTMYRLAFGQPRQEDFVDLLRRQHTEARTQPAINLRPPRQQ